MPKRGENIYRRKDNRWEARFIKERDDNGKIKFGYVHSSMEFKRSNMEKMNIIFEPSNSAVSVIG